MISTGLTQEDQLRASPPDPRFDLNAPRINPLVASVAASVTKGDVGITVAWASTPESVPVSDVLADTIDATRRDIVRFPSSAHAHANFGVALAKSSQFDEAIDELRTSLSIDPHHYVAGTTLASILATHGNFDEAKALYGELLKKFPNSDSILLSLAYISLRDHQFEQAASYLEEALRTNKRRAFPTFLLGITRLLQGNLHGAIAALREATRLEVRTGVFHHALGVAYAVTGDNMRAERCFRAALALSPDATESMHALCSILLSEKGRAVEVLNILKERVRLKPDDIEARELLARAYIQVAKYASSRAQLVHVLTAHGDQLSRSERSRFHTNIATTFLLERARGDAETELLRAIEIASDISPVPYEKLGNLYIESDRVEDAIATLRIAKKIFRSRQNVRRLLGVAYAELGLFELAIGELRTFWQEGTAEADTYVMLGTWFDWIGDQASALLVMSQAYQRFSKNSNVVNNLAYIYLMTGRLEEARAVLNSLPRAVVPHAELVATRGLLHLLEGDRLGGLHLYDKASTMARESGRSDLAIRVRQKMHLELARIAAGNGDNDGALREAKRGLFLKPKAYSYQTQLESLISSLHKA